MESVPSPIFLFKKAAKLCQFRWFSYMTAIGYSRPILMNFDKSDYFAQSGMEYQVPSFKLKKHQSYANFDHSMTAIGYSRPSLMIFLTYYLFI